MGDRFDRVKITKKIVEMIIQERDRQRDTYPRDEDGFVTSILADAGAVWASAKASRLFQKEVDKGSFDNCWPYNLYSEGAIEKSPYLMRLTCAAALIVAEMEREIRKG